MEYLLFTSEFCIKCPIVKKFVIEEVRVNGEIINASTQQGLKIAQKFNVNSVPTIIFF